MNAIYFGAKRAYYAMMRVTRRGLARLGLTAARFDLMYAVWECGGCAQQNGIWRALGVSRAVVSRMLRSLEELGYLTRERSLFDGRTRMVRLTELGRARIDVGVDRAIGSGVVQYAVDCALFPWTLGRLDPKASVARTHHLDDRLTEIRWAFGDSASLQYLRHRYEGPGEPRSSGAGPG